MSGYRIPADAHAILYRPCPWCSEWTPVGRETCIECEEDITTEQVSCRGCRGTGTYDGIDRGAAYRPGDPPVYRECRCDLCGGSGVLTPDPPPDAAWIEWMTAPPGDDDSRHIHELMIEPEAESSPWLWELRPVNGSTWVRAAGALGDDLYIVTESERGEVRVYRRTIESVAFSMALDPCVSAQTVADDMVSSGRGGEAGKFATSVIKGAEPVPLKTTEQDLEAALKASLEGV